MVPVQAYNANARFKATAGSRVWACVCLSVSLHFAFFAFFPPIGVAELNGESSRDDELTTYVLPEQPFIPPPPKPLDHPPLPPVGDVPQPERPEITSPDLEPPKTIDPPDVAEWPRDGGVFSPPDVPPKLLDPDRARRLVERLYPQPLRRAGIGGKVEAVAILDTLGSVTDIRLARSSGHDALDRAALEAARQFQFSPAMSRDRPVRVMVLIPIAFGGR